MAVTAPALDPIILNPTIRKCVENAANLREDAINLLKLLPTTLTSDKWQPVFERDVLPFAQKISKFYGLRKSALTAADRLTVEQASERTKLEASLKELDGRVGSIYKRISELQLNQGTQPFYIPQSTTQKSKSWLRENRGWIFSGFAATVAASQLAPKSLADTLSNFTIGKYTTPSNHEYAIHPFYVPLFMLREALGPEKSQIVGCAALGAAALYPTYRVTKRPVLAGCRLLDKGVNWLNNHPVLTLAAVAGLTYAGMSHLDPNTRPADLANRQMIAGGVGVATTIVIWAAKTVFDVIKNYTKKDEDPFSPPIVPTPPKPVAPVVAGVQPPPPVNVNIAAVPVRPAPPQPDIAQPAIAQPDAVVRQQAATVPADPRSTYQKVKEFSLKHPFTAFPAIGAGGFASLGVLTAAAVSWPIALTAASLAGTGALIGLGCAFADRAAQRELEAERNAAATV